MWRKLKKSNNRLLARAARNRHPESTATSEPRPEGSESIELFFQQPLKACSTRVRTASPRSRREKERTEATVSPSSSLAIFSQLSFSRAVFAAAQTAWASPEPNRGKITSATTTVTGESCRHTTTTSLARTVRAWCTSSEALIPMRGLPSAECLNPPACGGRPHFSDKNHSGPDRQTVEIGGKGRSPYGLPAPDPAAAF